MKSKNAFGFEVSKLLIAAVLAAITSFFIADYTVNRQFGNWVEKEKLLDAKHDQIIAQELEDLRKKLDVTQQYWNTQQRAVQLKETYDHQKELATQMANLISEFGVLLTDYDNAALKLGEALLRVASVSNPSDIAPVEERELFANRSSVMQQQKMISIIDQARYYFRLPETQSSLSNAFSAVWTFPVATTNINGTLNQLRTAATDNPAKQELFNKLVGYIQQRHNSTNAFVQLWNVVNAMREESFYVATILDSEGVATNGVSSVVNSDLMRYTSTNGVSLHE